MVNYHTTLINVLSEILPTYYELTLSKDCAIPCISYLERNNYEEYVGDSLGYSKVSYQVKVWGNSINEVQSYASAVDAALKPIGWKRTSTGEIFDINSTMIQKVMVYEALFHEEYTTSK